MNDVEGEKVALKANLAAAKAEIESLRQHMATQKGGSSHLGKSPDFLVNLQRKVVEHTKIVRGLNAGVASVESKASQALSLAQENSVVGGTPRIEFWAWKRLFWDFNRRWCEFNRVLRR